MSSIPITPDSPDWPGPKPGRPFRVTHLARLRNAGVPLTMLTSYDALSARIFDQAGVDMLLVGDSYATTMLGYDSTTQVGLSDMVTVTAAVARGASRALVVGDLPFGSYEASPAQAVESAVSLLRAGAAAVKLEGGKRVLPQVKAIVNAGIPVFGHLGFTPQSEHALGGKVVQGRGADVEALVSDSQALAQAGISALVLEMIPDTAARAVRAAIDTPLIGIGAGPHVDGQVLVWTDMAGLGDWAPSFSKCFTQLSTPLSQAAANYIAEVRSGSFPDKSHYHLD